MAASIAVDFTTALWVDIAREKSGRDKNTFKTPFLANAKASG
jgi:hypothetical protein